ncbi:hypothetical protein ABEB36_001179 [Hypothenemus hampei]|uniref:28S ribosomal protein S9, mitochondrial n=1 Tax=Hypothenemus hampei TaxID=57062 RepID=A0ABD1FEC6_HYPHA
MLRQISRLVDPLKGRNLSLTSSCVESKLLRTSQFSTNASESNAVEDVDTKKTLNKAMRTYLERAREHDEFMKTQRREFEIGKRHLANMMGENPDTFTQEDIDNAIAYLFPSGLYEKKARPMMKPPEEVFPQRKAAEFDETGRPYHFLFYTGRPNFYQILHEAVQHIIELNKFEDAMIRKKLEPDPNLTLELSGSKWIEKEILETNLVETITDKEYSSFINVMDRLASLPYSYRIKDLIMQYRKSLINQSKTFEAIIPQLDENGRQFVSVYECRRKRATASVTVRSPGTGKITINDLGIDYFNGVQQREQASVVWYNIFDRFRGKQQKPRFFYCTEKQRIIMHQRPTHGMGQQRTIGRNNV